MDIGVIIGEMVSYVIVMFLEYVKVCEEVLNRVLVGYDENIFDWVYVVVLDIFKFVF